MLAAHLIKYLIAGRGNFEKLGEVQTAGLLFAGETLTLPRWHQGRLAFIALHRIKDLRSS